MLATLTSHDQMVVTIAALVMVVLIAAIIASACMFYYGHTIEHFMEARNEKRRLAIKEQAEINRHVEQLAGIEAGKWNSIANGEMFIEKRP